MFRFVGTQTDNKFIYGGYLAVKGVAVWDQAARQGIDGEWLFRFV